MARSTPGTIGSQRAKLEVTTELYARRMSGRLLGVVVGILVGGAALVVGGDPSFSTMVATSTACLALFVVATASGPSLTLAPWSRLGSPIAFEHLRWRAVSCGARRVVVLSVVRR